MGRIFLPSEKWDKEKDLPTLMYKNGKIEITRTFHHLKKPVIRPENRTDLPIFSIDENGEPTIEKSMLDNRYCGRCLRNHYEPKRPRDHFVCTVDDSWRNLPDVEQDSFGKGCDYMAPISLPSYLRKAVSEKIARWTERPRRLYSFFKERAERQNIDLKRTSWREKVVKKGLLPYTGKHDLQKDDNF
jgi:hypothetical protein